MSRPPEVLVQEVRESLGITYGESGRPLLSRRNNLLRSTHVRQPDTRLRTLPSHAPTAMAYASAISAALEAVIPAFGRDVIQPELAAAVLDGHYALLISIRPPASQPVGSPRRSVTSPVGMVTWGLDLSTDPRKCAAVAIRWDAGRPEVVDVRTPLTPANIVELIVAQDAQFAVDVPFGWPDAFVDFVTAHRGHAQRPPSDREAWRKETLARRATDHRLLEHKALPLPASFDRLGKTAVMWSAVEFDLLKAGIALDRSGITGRVCETYPAAALAAWSLPKSKPSLELIERAFPFLTIGDEWVVPLSVDGDARDALVCALVARAAALQLTVGPVDIEQAQREGWIHIMEQDPRALLGGETARWLSVPLYVPTSTDLEADWPKHTFDFWRDDETQVDTMEEYAAGRDLLPAAMDIVNYPFPQAVPAQLSRQAWSLVTSN